MSDREIFNSREFNFSCAHVFEAFSDPKKLSVWWGPDGFTNIFEVFEFKKGGTWRFVMRGPDGKDYFNRSEFIEILPNKRIVILHLETMHRFTLTITFAGQGNSCRIDWRQVFEEPLRPEFRSFLLQANEQNFNRLQAQL